MTRRCRARTVLAADGAGCAVAAVMVLRSERVVSAVDPSLRSRWPVATALGATSALLVAGAMRDEPEDRDLERAAAVNAGWVVTCLAGLLRRPSRSGAVVLVTTAALDGAAAIAQLTLRSDTEDPHGNGVEFPMDSLGKGQRDRLDGIG